MNGYNFEKLINRILSDRSEFVIQIGEEGKNKLDFRIGDRRNLKEIDQANYALKFIPDIDIFIVWDWKRHKEYNLSMSILSSGYKKIEQNADRFEVNYKALGKSKNNPLEKVYIVGINQMQRFFDNYHNYMKFNEFDYESNMCPEAVKAECNWDTEIERKKHSCLRNQRDIRFRNDVLSAYEKQCAICRCNIVELLQAAHERGHEVAHTNVDNPQHGICLCANHHLMYDNELIDIDLEKLKIIIKKEELKKMPWYQEFKEKYKETIVQRNDYQENFPKK